jgi:hypothetical protein
MGVWCRMRDALYAGWPASEMMHSAPCSQSDGGTDGTHPPSAAHLHDRAESAKPVGKRDESLADANAAKPTRRACAFTACAAVIAPQRDPPIHLAV